MSESLYRAARADKQMIMIAGVGHEDALPAGGVILSRAITDLVGRCGRR
jgi:hypothetical protein